ncbi:MAG: hypothetical protein WBM98_12910 [Maribacter sp.]|uniref:hypothetical protein n=1 Tax=Maribacter sp. TaxID=1897614 RepID=UPI003C7531F8
MKTKPIIIIAFAALLMASCIKDHIGSGPEKVELTEENYLLYNNLYEQFATEEIERIDAQISKLSLISMDNSGYDDAQKQIASLKVNRAFYKNLIPALQSAGSINGIIRPCGSYPLGKCVPVALEFIVFPNTVLQAFARVQDTDDIDTGSASNLQPLPGFEKDYSYLRIPVQNSQNELKITIATTDIQENKASFKVVIGF